MSSSHSSVIDTVLLPINSEMKALDAFFEEQVNTFEPMLRPVFRHCFDHKGKRLRPIFAFYAARGATERYEMADLVKVAAIIEMIHVATIVHDDVLDQATLRHKIVTLGAKEGVDVAILFGDTLFAQALCLASDFPTTDVCKHVSRATRLLCSGEVMQTLSNRYERFDKHHYDQVIDFKTAELFSVACRLGSYVAKKSVAQQEALAQYGRHLGRAYQIFDDAMDIFGKESVFGKTLGTDFVTQKYTLPILLFLERLPKVQQNDWVKMFSAKKLSRERFIEIMHEANLLGEIKSIFYEQINLAKNAIKGLGSEHDWVRLADCIEGMF